MAKEALNIYELSRAWFDWSFENPDLITTSHTAIYFFAIEHCNRLGWKEKFGFPTSMAMEALGIKKHQTYIKYFNDLCEWGALLLVQKSANQYSANIISVQKMVTKNGKALDKALVKHGAKQTETNGQSTGQSNGSIDIQYTRIQENNNTILIRIGNETFQKKCSDIFKVEYKGLYEKIMMTTLKGMDGEIILAEMDNEYPMYDFKDVNHFANSLKSTGRKLKKVNGVAEPEINKDEIQKIKDRYANR